MWPNKIRPRRPHGVLDLVLEDCSPMVTEDLDIDNQFAVLQFSFVNVDRLFSRAFKVGALVVKSRMVDTTATKSWFSGDRVQFAPKVGTSIGEAMVTTFVVGDYQDGFLQAVAS